MRRKETYFRFADRIESHDYTNPQLYLATMFFATLLFILPTVLVYYTVFASVSCILVCWEDFGDYRFKKPFKNFESTKKKSRLRSQSQSAKKFLKKCRDFFLENVGSKQFNKKKNYFQLRFCVYCITYTVAMVQRQILIFPTYNYFKWLTGTFVNEGTYNNPIESNRNDETVDFFVSPENIKMTPHIGTPTINSFPYPVSVTSIEAKSSIPITRYPPNVNLSSDSLMSIDQFLLSLIRSDMLGFIYPQKKQSWDLTDCVNWLGSLGHV